MTRTTITTVITRLTTEEGAQHENSRQLGYRREDLTAYAKRGYVLASTVTAPEHEGTIIIDTLTHTEDY